MISYGKQYIDADDIDSVLKALKKPYLTQGPLSEKFETALKKYFNSSYCCVVSSGTAALHLSILALNCNKNDIILTTPMSFLASSVVK